MLEAEKLSYSVKNNTLLRNVTLKAERGKLIAIVGPNGAGKSTLLRLLSHEITSKGHPILFKGEKLENWSSTELPKHKAKFSQHYHHDIPLFVEDVVLMGRYPYFNSQPSLLDKEIVENKLLDLGIEHLAKKNYSQLSGGEKQRVHLARVMVQLENTVEHKLAFFDEPLNNLDILHQHRIMKNIKDFTQLNNTAMVVLHDLNIAAQYADSIVLMKQGQIAKQGHPEDVFTNDIISDVYNFPCTICRNPVTNNPLILFGN
ncbi:heme ABC transporter ATP-binding protein [Flavobacterium sp. NRK F10]|uniref:heme ABC transporter ATP-binding protein n=1 Tax=Flavobacterium sp. NRK F10 TaxID=2954931 RepID=UPI0020911300|nr:heme ABC transporter ATP-binding protein [Flavobacterium sp. NRK F10]MCO6175041.1 heme ABC transporter ATP-binding protein [Flavobacterium sp. NRK F10]